MAVCRINFLIILGAATIVWIYLFIVLAQTAGPRTTFDSKLEELSVAVEKLRSQAINEQEELYRIRKIIRSINNHDFSQKVRASESESARRQWKEPIVVLVFACNRPTAITNLIRKLISLRPSKELFPITVSQDCDNTDVQQAVAHFRENVNYVKHKSAQKEKIIVPYAHRRYSTYYFIARHYKLALEHVFNVLGYSTAILLEDDLDVSDDFFEYFSATRYLLERDPMLWCVSAWNDNGKNGSIDPSANSLLYRSDFFSGLGWMMTSKLWMELRPKWPAGFWDDWMREPEIRNGRQCIRPEISRTRMTPSGKVGASEGQFFEKHLSKVILNTDPVSFTSMNLDYLLNPIYDEDFLRTVYKDSPLMLIDKALIFSMQKENVGRSIRVEYTGNIDYIVKADKLHVMHDFKAGVPRTAYHGIVSCFMNGIRIFLVPNMDRVKGYDKRWQVPTHYDA